MPNRLNSEHIHHSVSSLTLRTATQNPFTPHSHSLPTLVYSIQSTLQSHNQIQQAALNSYFSSPRYSVYSLASVCGSASKSSFRKLHHKISYHKQACTDIDTLTAYFTLFDSVFFYGSLRTVCRLELTERSRGLVDEATVKVATFESNQDQVTSRITIHALVEESDIRRLQQLRNGNGGLVKGMSRKDRIRFYLGVLLHEMIHVFLYTYTCSGGSCKVGVAGGARLGHCEAWFEIAFGIERAVLGLLDMKVDLGRRESLVLELSLCGSLVDFGGMGTSSMSETEKWESWGYDKKDIENVVMKCGAWIRKQRRNGGEFWAFVRVLRGNMESVAGDVGGDLGLMF